MKILNRLFPGENPTVKAASAGGAAKSGGAATGGFGWSGVKSIGANALASGALQAGKTIRAAYPRFRNNELNAVQYTREIVRDTGKTAVMSGSATMIGLALSHGARSASKTIGNETLKRLVNSNVGSTIAFGGAELMCYAFANRRSLTAREFARKASATTTTAAGGLSGTMLGAAIGTFIMPGIGTTVGALAGSLFGGLGCSRLYGIVDRLVFRHSPSMPPSLRSASSSIREFPRKDETHHLFPVVRITELHHSRSSTSSWQHKRDKISARR